MDDRYVPILGSLLVIAIAITAFVVGIAANNYGYREGYNAGIQDIMSGKVHPTAAATRWVVEQPEKQQ